MDKVIKLEKIYNGNLEIRAGVKYDFSELEEITGYCDISSNVEFKAPKLTTIGGYCDIYSNVEFKAPKLTTIGGYCDISSNVELPKLTTIGGYCDIYSNVELPKLTTIGGYCYIYSNVEFKAHKNLKTNDKNAREYCKQFTFNVFFKLGFFFADNILAKLISSKTNKNGSKVHKVQIVGQTKISYCIEVDGVFSHGDTLKEAKESLIYKISNRDKSMYEDYTLDSVVTFEDAVKMYRVITGACEAGTRNFVQGLVKRKKKYTVAEIITATQGQYGNETFKEFFNG